MQVYKIDPIESDGSFNIYVWDTNDFGQKALKHVKVDSNGDMFFEGRELASVNRVPWDDFEITNITINLLEFCQKNPSLCVDVLK